jgi:ribonuclease D
MQELHIHTADQLDALCRQIGHSPWLALDTEFMREKTYHPRLCLLQLSNGELTASIDPLALEDRLEPLLEILFDPAIVKVFHAGRQDLEIFQLLWQRLPSPLFDTQSAAALLGLGDQIGYGNLVEKVLGKTLEKGHTRTDWCRRPLQPEQLRYALDDVIYLGQLYLELSQRLQAQGRGDWLQEEFEQLADPTTYIIDPEQAWKRVKGHQRLKGKQLAVLQALAAWREKEALRADRPRRWIIKDEPLLDLARRQPRNMDQLQQIRGLEGGLLKRHGATLLTLIDQAAKLPPERWPAAQQQPIRLSANQEAMVDLLMCSLRLLADEQGITPAALASRKALERLVTGEREIDLLRGWRRKLAGDRLLQVLQGEWAPRIQQGRLTLQQV